MSAAAIILLSQLDWLRFEHKHRLCSLLLAVAPSQPLRQFLVGDYDIAGLLWQCLLYVFDLANCRNASRRRGWLLPGCAMDELRVAGSVSVIHMGSRVVGWLVRLDLG